MCILPELVFPKSILIPFNAHKCLKRLSFCPLFADDAAILVEERLEKRLLVSRFSLLKLLLDCASSKESGPQVRAKSVKALGEVVRVDARLLSMQQVAVTLRTAMHVSPAYT